MDRLFFIVKYNGAEKTGGVFLQPRAIWCLYDLLKLEWGLLSWYKDDQYSRNLEVLCPQPL